MQSLILGCRMIVLYAWPSNGMVWGLPNFFRGCLRSRMVSSRFSVSRSSHTRNQGHLVQTASACCKMIEPLFFREKAGTPIQELSFCFSPKKVNVPPFREKYQALKDFLSANGIDTRQAINGANPF